MRFFFLLCFRLSPNIELKQLPPSHERKCIFMWFFIFIFYFYFSYLSKHRAATIPTLSWTKISSWVCTQYVYTPPPPHPPRLPPSTPYPHTLSPALWHPSVSLSLGAEREGEREGEMEGEWLRTETEREREGIWKDTRMTGLVSCAERSLVQLTTTRQRESY